MSSIYFFFIFLLLCLSFNRKDFLSKSTYSIVFISLGFFYSFYFFPTFLQPNQQVTGIGEFVISSSYSSYNSNVYMGKFKTFKSHNQEKIYKNIYCKIYVKKRPLYKPNTTFLIDGTLRPKNKYFATLKTTTEWGKHKKINNLIEVRKKAKRFVRSYLKKSYKNHHVRNFIAALMIGDKTDNFLNFSFNRLGLQHVIAISGFHFGFLVLFFSFILRIFFPANYLTYLLLFITNGFFLFVGSSPSIQRAWIMIQLVLISQIFTKRNSSLNALGISLLIETINNPLSILNIGFQLSFLCTASILLTYPIWKQLLSKVFKKRTSQEIKNFSFFSKVGYGILSFLRENIILMCSVNFVVIPLCLFHFHKFPIISLLYNLFFPACVGITLMLFLISCIFSLIFYPLGMLLHTINNFFTQMTLDLVLYPPHILEYYLRIHWISVGIVTFYLSLFFLIAINKTDRKNSFPQIFL